MVKAVLDRMTEELADGDRVELRDFGTFAARDREARTGRNPRSGKMVVVAAKRAVHFKPSKTMRAWLNLAKVALEDEADQLLAS